MLEHLLARREAAKLAERTSRDMILSDNRYKNNRAINRGGCMRWARRFVRGSWRARVLVWHRLVPHAFVHLDGRYYDAETPCGVTDWRRLPLFCGLPPETLEGDPVPLSDDEASALERRWAGPCPARQRLSNKW